MIKVFFNSSELSIPIIKMPERYPANITVEKGWTWNDMDVISLKRDLHWMRKDFDNAIEHLDISLPVLNYKERKELLDLCAHIRSWPSILETVAKAREGQDLSIWEKRHNYTLPTADLNKAYRMTRSSADALMQKILLDLDLYSKSDRPNHDHLDLLIACFGESKGIEHYSSYMWMWWINNPPF